MLGLLGVVGGDLAAYALDFGGEVTALFLRGLPAGFGIGGAQVQGFDLGAEFGDVACGIFGGAVSGGHQRSLKFAQALLGGAEFVALLDQCLQLVLTGVPHFLAELLEPSEFGPGGIEALSEQPPLSGGGLRGIAGRGGSVMRQQGKQAGDEDDAAKHVAQGVEQEIEAFIGAGAQFSHGMSLLRSCGFQLDVFRDEIIADFIACAADALVHLVELLGARGFEVKDGVVRRR